MREMRGSAFGQHFFDAEIVRSGGMRDDEIEGDGSLTSCRWSEALRPFDNVRPDMRATKHLSVSLIIPSGITM
jgi:hypothetical protein